MKSWCWFLLGVGWGGRGGGLSGGAGGGRGLQRAADDFAHVAAQAGVGGHALDGGARGAAAGLRQAGPAIERARQAGGHLRVERIQRQHLLGPEGVARAVGAVEGGGVVHAVGEDQGAGAVGVFQAEVAVAHELAHGLQPTRMATPVKK